MAYQISWMGMLLFPLIYEACLSLVLSFQRKVSADDTAKHSCFPESRLITES